MFQDILASNGLSESSPVNFEAFLDLLPRNRMQISDDEHRFVLVGMTRVAV